MWAMYVILNFLVATLKEKKKIGKNNSKKITFYFTQYIQSVVIVTGTQHPRIIETFCILWFVLSLRNEERILHSHLCQFGLATFQVLTGLGQCGPKDIVAFFSYNEAMPVTETKNGSLGGIMSCLPAETRAMGVFGFINSSPLCNGHGAN